jgi:hypothetical protein
MVWIMRWSALVLLVGFTLPLLADDAKKPDDKQDAAKKADDKKGDDAKPDEPKKEEEKKEKLLPAGTLQGKITKFDEDKKTFKLEITFSVAKVNEGEANAYLQAQTQYQQAMVNRNSQQLANAMRDMQTHYAKLYNYEKKTQEVELQILDDAKIRMVAPPPAFDDDGKPHKYTKKELDELKGDPKLPGFPAELSSLGTGQQVQVALVRKKTTKPMYPPAKGAGAPGLPKPKDGMNPDALADHLPLVSMIMLMQKPDK